jgi:positive regulator of sigma E activity
MQEPHNTIEHPGIVEKTEGNKVWVNIMPQSACGSCHSKTYCGMAEVANKLIETRASLHQTYLPGQQVTVALRKSLGYKALFLGYMFPFLLILFSLMITLHITGNELVAALISISTMIPYYSILFFRKEKIRASFQFYIKS